MTENTPPRKARGGRPRRDEAEKTATRILDTAAELFAARGYAATSVEQVAAACSAGKDTIYRRFPSKSALFSAVVARMQCRVLERLEAEIARLPAQEDAMLRLRRVARWFLTVNLDPELVAFRRIALSEAVVSDAEAPDAAADDPIMSRLVAVVAEAQEVGALRHSGGPRRLADHLLHSIVFGPSNDAMLGRKALATKAAQDRYFDEAWDLFLHGATRRGD